MKSWKEEVKPGEKRTFNPQDDFTLIHLTKAVLKEPATKPVNLYLEMDIEHKVVEFGHLSTDLSFDLVFERKFKLYHDSPDQSVFFWGDQTTNDPAYEEAAYSSSDEDVGSKLTCYSCGKQFGSNIALITHKKAKHPKQGSSEVPPNR